jgi:hypothetical protein
MIAENRPLEGFPALTAFQCLIGDQAVPRKQVSTLSITNQRRGAKTHAANP